MSIATQTTRAPHVVRVSQADGLLLIAAPFALLDWCRAIPGARWDGKRRTWTASAAGSALAWMREHSRCAIECDESIEEDAAPLMTSEAPPAVTRSPAPWRHQAMATNFCLARPAALLFCGMGTGKSRATIDVINNLDQSGPILVLCPVSVLDVWRRELATWLAVPAEICILDEGTTVAKIGRAKIACAARRAIVVVNYETARMKQFAAWALAMRWRLVILDESHRAKNATGETGKFVMRLSRQADRRLCLTGTPMPHSPGDIFSQYRFLDPTIFGTTWTGFKARYAVMGGFHDKQIVKWINQEEMHEKIYRIAFHVGREVLDLPSSQHIERPVKLRGEARRVYEELERDMVADVASGVVTAANALVRLLKLQQCTSGFCMVETDAKSHLYGLREDPTSIQRAAGQAGEAMPGLLQSNTDNNVLQSLRQEAVEGFRKKADDNALSQTLPGVGEGTRAPVEDEKGVRSSSGQRRKDRLPTSKRDGGNDRSQVDDLRIGSSQERSSLGQSTGEPGTVGVSTEVRAEGERYGGVDRRSVSVGSLGRDQRTLVRLDSAKADALRDILEDLPTREPVVVFANFHADLDAIRETTESLGRRYGELSGRGSCLTSHAKMPDDIDVLGVQVQSGGVGVDFTRAAYAVYYSVNWSLGIYDQSLARLHRPGQTRPVVYYHLIAEHTVDRAVYKAFRAKREIIEAVLGDFKCPSTGSC